MQKLTIMERVDLFFKNETEQKLFTGLGKRPLISEQWFVSKDLQTQKEEKLKVYNDLNDQKRIRCKGQDFAFSLNQDMFGNYYLDHLLLGKIEQEDFYFSMRRKKNYQFVDENAIEENSFIIKQVKENMLHVMTINEQMLNMTILQAEDQTIVEQYHFHYNEDQKIILDIDTTENRKKAFQEFIVLERTYPTITSYINDSMPIMEQVITFCHELPDKAYDIKVKKQEEITQSNYKGQIIDIIQKKKVL